MRSIKKTYLLGAFLGLWVGSTAAAQTPSIITIDIAKANLSWSWVAGAPPNDGLPDQFLVKCAPLGTVRDATGKNYATGQVVTGVPYPTMKLPVTTAIKSTSGSWTCMVTAANVVGESNPTADVTFKAGSLPSDPAGLSITAQ